MTQSLSTYGKRNAARRGYTLIELIVAVGLFAFVMMMSASAYLIMIALNHQAQGTTVGINNLSFALETMTRDIRTGSAYSCGGAGDCPTGGASFSFNDKEGTPVSYSLSGSSLQKVTNGVPVSLTDPSVVITSLTFYTSGSQPVPSDYHQPRLTIIVVGSVSTGPGKTQPFTVETGATMRGSDI